MSHHYLKNVPSVEYRSFVTHIPEQTLIKDQNEFKVSDTYAEVFQDLQTYSETVLLLFPQPYL